MRLNVLLGLLVAGLGSLLPGRLAQAQIGGPQDYDMKLIPDKKLLLPAEEMTLDSTVTVRKAGVLGWSYGVEHDENLLEVLSATTEGTDVPGVFLDGFNQTRIITQNDVKVGWIQAVVLSLSAEKRELPISPRFVMARAVYKVREGVCNPQSAVSTTISYSDRLSVPGSPPVETLLTAEGLSVVPAILEPAQVSIKECPVGDLKLTALPAQDRKLTADGIDVLPINILIQNTAAAGTGPVEVQGWSYGLQVDPAVLTVTDLTTGAHAAAVNGGAGPDFKAYNWTPLDQNASGTVKGVSVGVVLSLDPPNEVIAVPAGESRHTETLRVKSAINIGQGQPDRSTQLQFVNEVLGGDRPIENIITVGGVSVSPKVDTPTLGVTLTAITPEKRFRRGFANPDARFDIADGIWTIRVLFYREGQLACQDAADANDDGRVDVSDAVYTFNYLLQPGKRQGDTLFPRPPEPFAACGLDTTADGLGCDTATQGCN